MKISIFFVSTLISIFAISQGRQDTNIIRDCPKKCWCYQTAVRCMFQGLTRIPEVPINSTVLDLRFNDIVDIPTGMFHGWISIDTILLNDNKIHQLKKNQFIGLSNLKILYLYKNRITSIAPGAFEHLLNLRQLYLHENRLTEIESSTFSNLPNLERLFLQNNKLHRIPADAFENVGPMTRLRLDSNALVCDCDLLWLVERFRKIPSEMAAVCHAPLEMEGRSLMSMSTDDFHCHTPEIMQGPEDVYAEIGETAQFNCKVTGDPKPKVKWMRNSNKINIDGKRYIVKDDGTLIIRNVSENDIGEYECIAESKMGSTVSRRARAVITASPSIRFTEIPNSQTVIAGQNVILTCKAQGRPSPEIEWWRNGQRIYDDNRIILEDDGTILRIIGSNIRDSARYICQGRNIHGLIEVSADLKVIEQNSTPPKLLYMPPDDMETEVGATVELPCRAEGQPKPIIQWKKDGSALETISRYKISRGGSLYISNITVSDAGRYECNAINDYGRATAHGLLKVREIPVTSNNLIQRAFYDATESVDRAINQTLQSLFGIDGAPPLTRTDPFRLARFPNAAARAAARPAEIFERTLVNIRKYIEQGMTVNVTGPFNYQDILTAEQVNEIERLSGCTGHRKIAKCKNLCFHSKYRTIDGTCNNLKHTNWGSSYTGFRRILQPIYENGFSQPIGWDKTKLYYGFHKPAARLISTKIISTNDITSDNELTHMVMQWGQFLDHDLDHALPSVSSESWDGIDCKKSCDNAAPCFPMEVPPGDPRITNRRCIDFVRTSAVCGSGMTSILWGEGMTPREQMNQLTSYLDASQVYGYNDELAKDLRELQNNRGLLREGAALPGRKAMLPYMSGQFVDCRRNPLESSINCFVAGDIRANEQVGLLAMHTIWLREHNRIVRNLEEFNPHWSGEKLYQEARRIVGAEMQHITYEQWIPKIFGQNIQELIGSYNYDADLDPRISNVFATAALRFGHSLIQPRLERLNESFQSIPQGPLDLRDAFFSPWRLVDEGGVDPLLRGMFATAAKLKLPEQNLNNELTEQLFKTAHAVALDLAAMNIQRGREHGIPGYLEWRKYCNMSYVDNFDDLAGDIRSSRIRRKLKELYGHPGNMDVWVGGILEDQLPNAKVGPLFKCLLLEQFRRTRDGDRFWYENPSSGFKPEQLQQIKQISLARILCDNGDNITQIQKDIFLLPTGENNFINCDEIPSIDLRFWSDCCENCESIDNNILRVRRNAEKYMKHMNAGSPNKIEISNLHVTNLEKMVINLQEETKRLHSLANELAEQLKKLENNQ